mmetsp:Transcript_6193/g.5600  ORF Transcript_6193/g.5600 Transcript_6193/m.5600 type:complete len:116 (+) Transcript_6193:64-411(+)
MNLADATLLRVTGCTIGAAFSTDSNGLFKVKNSPTDLDIEFIDNTVEGEGDGIFFESEGQYDVIPILEVSGNEIGSTFEYVMISHSSTENDITMELQEIIVTDNTGTLAIYVSNK